MPIENIIKSQKQGKLFGYKLKEELNPNNKLYKLRELINWSRLEHWLSKNDPINRFGSLLGEAGYNEILGELIRVGIKTNTVKKKIWN
ncbi:MAG: hypothetical protein RCG15_07960 [Candidatus Rickettsia vulgarisii]